jgi:hypothetical protein
MLFVGECHGRAPLDGGDDPFAKAPSGERQGGSAKFDAGTMLRSLLGDRGTTPRQSLGQENPRPPFDDESQQSVVATVAAHARWHRSVVARAFNKFRRDGSDSIHIRGYMMDLAKLDAYSCPGEE